MRALFKLLAPVGTVVAVVGLSKLHAVMNTYDYTGSFRFAWSLTYAVLLGVMAYGAGLPDLVPPRKAPATALVALLAGAGFISFLQLFVGDALLPRFVVFGSVGVLVVWLTTCSFLAAGGNVRAEDRTRVFVVAEDAELALLRDDLQAGPERPVTFVGGCAPDAARPAPDDAAPLRERVRQSGATLLVLSRAAQADEGIVHQAAMLHESGVRVRTLSLFYEQWLGKLPIGELERVSLLFDISEVHHASYVRLKRVFDVVIAVAALPILALLIPGVFVGNAMANRGPLFYRQPRVGKNDRVFDILKFRTMRPGDRGLVNEWTREDDPRITPFGRLLRLTHTDELPQVVNVVRGDLSIVGPRPEQPHYVAELVAKLPFYHLRHAVRPGITGWAQVKYGYAGNETDALEKLQYDFYYLRHQSIALDTRIVGRTLRSVVRAGGR